MPTNANPKKLQIPKKNTRPKDQDLNQNDADINWRAIEGWANGLNPILQLTAGPGITLTPSDGEGPTVEIASTGGGSTYNMFGAQAGEDSANTTIPMWLSGVDPDSAGLITSFPIFSPQISGGPFTYSFGISYITFPTAGQSVMFLPYNQFPLVYTGGAVGSAWQMTTLALDFSNFYTTSIANVPIPSGSGSFQLTDTDFAPLVPIVGGGDISLVAGSGTSGNGLVSAAGGKTYFTSLIGSVTAAFGTVFTP